MVQERPAPNAPPAELPEVQPDMTATYLGERLRALRKEMGWTLQDLARRSGVSLSTLSKIENVQVAPTFDTLVKAARGLGISFETLIAQPAAEPASNAKRAGGRLMVTRAGDAVGFSTPMYEYRVHANGLKRKHMTPLIMAVKARTPEDVTGWSSHEGEELILVLKGRIELHSEFYGPVVLEQGDSAYIDSDMAHMFLNVGEGEALMASICYSDAIDGPGVMAQVPSPETAES